MHPAQISITNVPLSVAPERTFHLIGHIYSLDRGLNKTIAVIKTVDNSRPTDNVDTFTLVFRDSIKAMVDKMVKLQTMVIVTGQMNCVGPDHVLELEGKHLIGYNGATSMWQDPPAPRQVRNNDFENLAY